MHASYVAFLIPEPYIYIKVFSFGSRLESSEVGCMVRSVLDEGLRLSSISTSAPSMAVLGLGLACRTHFPHRPPLLPFARKQVRVSSVMAAHTIDEAEDIANSDGNESGKVQQSKRFSSEDLGITSSMISRPAKKVLNELKKKGYQVYLVGGCVRDLAMKLEPKDFDIVTTAELRQVKTTFSRCEIIGRRFPICHVHVGDTYVEVSSFNTAGRMFDRGLRSASERPPDCDDEDFIRWKDSLRRDFTINGLLFDPYAKIVYDYRGGIEDIKRAKVRTIIPASTSFKEDSARILRGIRIAARLGFQLSKETARSVKELALLLLRLDKKRLHMEMNYLLAYGSAEASLRLLWKFGLLEILLPIQASYMVQNGFRRREKRSNMLLSLFANLDKLLAPNRPCNSSLWVAILAFHKALCDRPRDPLVVAAFSLAVHSGGDIPEAVKIAKQIHLSHDRSFQELLEPCNLKSEALVKDVMDLAASVKDALQNMTDERFISQAMAAYPQAPYSDLVLVPYELQMEVDDIFGCVHCGIENRFVAKQGGKIEYKALASGSLAEIRHVFARIVFDTVFPLHSNKKDAKEVS